jgi:hypothetical protein
MHVFKDRNQVEKTVGFYNCSSVLRSLLRIAGGSVRIKKTLRRSVALCRQVVALAMLGNVPTKEFNPASESCSETGVSMTDIG